MPLLLVAMHLFLVANLVTTSKALVTSNYLLLVTSSFFVTTSKAPVTTSVALVTSSFLVTLEAMVIPNLRIWLWVWTDLTTFRLSRSPGRRKRRSRGSTWATPSSLRLELRSEAIALSNGLTGWP